MTVNEFIEKYKRDNFDSYFKENATVDYWNDLIKTYKLEKLKFVFPESMQLTLNPLLKEGNDMFWGKEFDGFCERQIEKLEIEKQYKPQQPESIKKEPKIKGILTNETYFTILEKCTIEAFESLKLKELYPKNGAKAIWDVSTLTITKGDGLPTERDNELFRKEYILDNMRVTFLIALDRFCKDFEIKNSITREFFYKKCYQSILLKTAQSPLWHEPDFGFDINKEPCKLTFIWNMRHDIEAKSIEPKPIPQQPRPETLDLSDTSAVEKPSFTNEFDKVPESKVIEYFTKNLVEKKYLTEIELNKYLKQAFELRDAPKEKYSFKNIDSIENIVNVFYTYFKEVTTQSTYGRQSEYFNLLKNYFNGFEKIHIKNFSKQYDSIRNLRN